MLETVLRILNSLPMADILLGLAALGAGMYCLLLARRLRQMNSLEDGMGGAIAVLSAQIDDLTKMLDRAEASAKLSASQLEALTDRSEKGPVKLELLLAALHDLPEPEPVPEEPVATFVRSSDGPLVLEAAE